MVEFKNLTAGYYFVRLTVGNHKAFGGIFIHCSKELIIGWETGPEVVIKDPSQEHKVSSTYLYAVCPVVALIIPAIAVTIWVKKYWSPSYSLPSFSSSGAEISGIFEAASKSAEELEIVLLYSRDFKEHNQVVEAFGKFLINYWNLKRVRFDKEEEHVITGDLYSWTEGVTTNAENRRFIIVESEGAVQQEEAKKKAQVVQQIEGDFLNSIFPFALQMLKAGDNGVWNYKQIFVVRFAYTPEDCKLSSFVPKRRYVIPDDMFDLYHNMLDLTFPSSEARDTFKNTLEREWSEFLQRECHPLINAAILRVHTNPQTVAEAFEKRDLV